MSQFEGGPPLWHVSVAYHHPVLGIVPVQHWPAALREEAEGVARRALGGAGNETREKWETGVKAIHLRRVMSEEEQARLGGDIAAIRCKFGHSA